MVDCSNPSTSLDRAVEWVDTDASGHQHNSAIMRWMEAAEAQLMRELDLTDYFPLSPRVQHLVNFREPLWFGQRVTVTVWVERVGTTSLTLGFEIVGHSCDRSQGGTAADGTVTTAHVPPGEHSSAPWPATMRAAFEGRKP